MKAMQLAEYGPNSMFKLVELPIPKPSKGEVLIRVSATSVNWADVKAKELGNLLDFSPSLPGVFGMDVSGTVEEIGDGVQKFKKGDRIYGCVGGVKHLNGTNAEFIVADQRLIAKAPQSLAQNVAAGLPLVSITAWEGLHDRAKIKRGENLLVIGGAGGVGHIACQLGIHLGANVTATTRTQEEKDFLSSVGVKSFIEIDKQDLVTEAMRISKGKGFDVVYDTVGSENILRGFECARRNGQIVTTVSLATLDLTLAHIKGLTLHVVYMLMPMMYDEHRETHGVFLEKLSMLVDEKAVTPRIHPQKFSLTQLNEAYGVIDRGEARGKLIINVGS